MDVINSLVFETIHVISVTPVYVQEFIKVASCFVCAIRANFKPSHVNWT